MESSSCTRPHFQGRAWPPRPPPAARDPPSHSSLSAIVVVPAMPPPGHPAATAPPSRCRSPRRSSSCSRLTRGPCCRSRPLEGRPRPCSAAMFAQPLPLLLLLLPSLLLATVAQRGAKRWWTRNARNGALHNGPAQHSLGRRQPSGRGPLVLPPHHLIRRPRCTLRALVDEKRQERGPVRHGPGRHQPDESSSSPFAGRAHVSTARLASNAAIRYLHHQICPSVLLHPPGRQLLCLGGGCGRAPKLAVIVCRTHACRHRPTVFVRQTHARLHRPVNVHRPQNPPGLG